MKTSHLPQNDKFKRVCAATLACTTAVLALNCASASTITVSDLTDGPPIVTSDIPGLNIDVRTPEVATITGTFLIPATGVPVIALGSHSVLLTEPSADPFGSRVSDIVTLNAVAVQNPAGGIAAENITLQFLSDGAVGFDALAATLTGLQTPTVAEDGTFQDLSAVLDSGNVTIKAQSDFNSSEVPDGASTAGLLGIALIGAILFARSRSVAAI